MFIESIYCLFYCLPCFFSFCFSRRKTKKIYIIIIITLSKFFNCSDDGPKSYAGLPCPKPKCDPQHTLVETEIETIDGCPYYKCLINDSTSDDCSKPSCPPGYELRRISDHAARYSAPGSVELAVATQSSVLLGVQCPRYECVPGIQRNSCFRF